MPTSIFIDYSLLWEISGIICIALVAVWPVRKSIRLVNKS